MPALGGYRQDLDCEFMQEGPCLRHRLRDPREAAEAELGRRPGVPGLQASPSFSSLSATAHGLVSVHVRVQGGERGHSCIRFYTPIFTLGLGCKSARY